MAFSPTKGNKRKTLQYYMDHKCGNLFQYKN